MNAPLVIRSNMEESDPRLVHERDDAARGAGHVLLRGTRLLRLEDERDETEDEREDEVESDQ